MSQTDTTAIDMNAEEDALSPKAYLATQDQALVSELIGMIGQLPQAKFLTTEKVSRWLAAILQNEPARAKWHIKRLSGIGGSEIGTLVSPFMDVYDPFGQPKDVFMDKLMWNIPQPSNGHMRRGTYMEDMIGQAFLGLFQATRLEKEMAQFGQFKDPKHPWLVGNPDDYVVIGDKRYMVDYKCPMPGFAEKYDQHGVSFGYICQLHHYTTMARKMNLPVDGLLLCSWDMANWSPDVRAIDMNEDIFRTILEAGDWIWNDHILKGTMPTPSYAPKLQLTDDDNHASRLRYLIERTSKLSIIANKAYAEVKDIKVEMTELMQDRKLGNQKLAYGIMDVKAEEKLNMERVTEFLAKLGKTPHDFMVEGGYESDLILDVATKANLDLSKCKSKVVDEAAMLDFLSANHVDREQLVDQEISVGLSRSSNEDVKKALSDIKKEAVVAINEFHLKFQDQFMPEIKVKAKAGPKP